MPRGPLARRMGWYDDYGPGSYEAELDDYLAKHYYSDGSDRDPYDSYDDRDPYDSYDDDSEGHEDDGGDEDYYQSRDRPKETFWLAVDNALSDDESRVQRGIFALEQLVVSGDVAWPCHGDEAALEGHEAVERYAALESAPDANAEAAAALAHAFTAAAAFDWLEESEDTRLETLLERRLARESLGMEDTLAKAHYVLLSMLDESRPGSRAPRLELGACPPTESEVS